MRRRWKVTIAVVATVLALLLTNAAVMSRETRDAEVRAAGGQIIRLGGGDLHVTDGGPRSEKALVLMHGYACSVAWWDAVLPELTKQYRVIRIDLLGHGGSEKPRDGYSFEDQGRLYGEALDKLGVKRAVLVGQAFGGILATPTAEQRPDLVAGTVLIGAPPNEDVGEMGFLIRLGLTPVVGQAMRRIAWDGAIKSGYDEAFGHGDFSLFDGTIDEDRAVDDYRALTFSSYKNARREFPDYVEDAPLDERFANLGLPLLAIFGEDDNEYDAKAALAVYDKVPNAETELIPDAGHGPHVEKPREIADLILRFAKGAFTK